MSSKLMSESWTRLVGFVTSASAAGIAIGEAATNKSPNPWAPDKKRRLRWARLLLGTIGFSSLFIGAAREPRRLLPLVAGGVLVLGGTTASIVTLVRNVDHTASIAEAVLFSAGAGAVLL